MTKIVVVRNPIIYRIKDLARDFCVSTRTVRRWIHDGLLRPRGYRRVGGSALEMIFTSDEVERFLDLYLIRLEDCDPTNPPRGKEARAMEVAQILGQLRIFAGKATIVLSRTLGEENAPKTQGSARTITLLPNVVDLLKTLLPLHVGAEDYVFTDDQGQPIDQNEFGRKFQDALRVLKIRPRPFYNTRHTYISVALTLRCNPKWIAEQTGTSLAMIQQNYGKYIRDDGDAPLRAYVESLKTGQNKEETETFTETFSGERANYAASLVVPTGFEPVLPT